MYQIALIFAIIFNRTLDNVMGGASCRSYSVCTSTAFSVLLTARSGILKVACEERKKMATAPEEGATAELKPLTTEDEDYNPFSDEGKRLKFDLGRSKFACTGAQGYACGSLVAG